MSNKKMSTLTIGENTYEVVDETARAEIETLKQTGGGCDCDVEAVVEATNNANQAVADTYDWLEQVAPLEEALSEKIDEADKAITSANNATALASNRASSAEVAAINANEKAALANNQALAANSAATEALYAKTAIETARNNGEFDGKDGTSVTVTSVSESTESGGSNVVTFSDNKTLTVKNGKDGKTPVAGVDYYTEEEKSEFSEYIASELAKRGRLKPEFANDISECTDTSKVYVLPDGNIYAYMYKEVLVGGYTNMVDSTSDDFKAGYRYNAIGDIATSSVDKTTCFVSNMFPCKCGDILRIKGVTKGRASAGGDPYFGAGRLLEDGTKINNSHVMYLEDPHTDPTTGQWAWNAYTTLEDGTIEWVFAVNNDGNNMADGSYGAYTTVVNTRICGIATNGYENIIVTVNEEIIEPTVAYEYAWANTGHAFVPADYEDRIIDLEQKDLEVAKKILAIEDELANKADEETETDSPIKWCAMGDSITEGYVSYLDGETPKSKVIKESAWVTKVAELNGWALTNKGIGGTGWIDLAGEVAAWHTARDTDFTPYNLVTLAFGVNDWKGNQTLGTINDDIATPTTIYAGMKATIEAIMASNPLCKIVVITPLNCVGYGFVYGTEATNWALGHSLSRSGTLEDVYEAMVEVCEYYGIEYIDMTHKSVVNRKNILACLTDGVHPNAETHALMAYELAKKITNV